MTRKQKNYSKDNKKFTKFSSSNSKNNVAKKQKFQNGKTKSQHSSPSRPRSSTAEQEELLKMQKLSINSSHINNLSSSKSTTSQQHAKRKNPLGAKKNSSAGISSPLKSNHNKKQQISSGHDVQKKFNYKRKKFITSKPAKKKSSVIDSNFTNAIQDQLLKQRIAATNDTNQSKPVKNNKEIANFHYDPLKKTYFPKSHMKKQSQKYYILRQKLKEKKLEQQQVDECQHSSSQSIIYDINSLSYCHSHNKRSLVRRQVIEKLITKNIFVQCCYAPMNDSNSHLFQDVFDDNDPYIAFHETLSNTENLREDKKSWISMVSPIILPSNMLQSRFPESKLPIDCQCKQDLHPTSPTFSLLPSSEKNKLPHMATIVNGGVYYRPSHDCNEPLFLIKDLDGFCQVKTNTRDDSSAYSCSFVQAATLQNQPTCVKFNTHSNNSISFGIVSNIQSSKKLQQVFSYCDMSQPSFRIESQYLDVQDVISNFAFSSDKVAFTSALLLDLSTSTFTPLLQEPFSSDAFCVDFLDSTTLLYGHRNGSISMLDVRASSCISFETSSFAKNYGSVDSIICTEKNLHQVLVHSTFGYCSMLDLRYQSPKKCLWQCLPSYNINMLHTSKCSGIAIDPFDGTTCTFPFVTNEKETMLAIASLRNGQLVDCVKLQANLDFCELSNTTTSAYYASYDCLDKEFDTNTSCSWGVWFKGAGDGMNYIPKPLGGIHHVRFG